MISLLILGTLLLALWVFGVLERDGRAQFMRSWTHVPLIAALIVLLMAAGAAFVDIIR
jgi:hypothetical protein